MNISLLMICWNEQTQRAFFFAITLDALKIANFWKGGVTQKRLKIIDRILIFFIDDKNLCVFFLLLNLLLFNFFFYEL